MIISEGTLKTPQSLANWNSSWFPSVPPMSFRGWPSAYAGIYRRQLWPYVVINKLARAQARLPLPLYERDDTNGRVRRDDHPMSQLLRNPNPALSGYALWLWTASTRNIYGETFWWKRRVRGPIGMEIYPLHPSAMTENPDGSWTFDNGKLILREIPGTDIVPFLAFNPDSQTRGLSPLEPLRSTLENEWSARVATASFWQRGARPAMALSHPKTLGEAAQARLKAQMDSVAAGADKTGVTVVLEEGMEPKVMSLTAEEAQYIETRKLNREEVCAAYDIPPPVVHILDHATFSNITEQLRSMYRDTMGSVLPDYESVVQLHLAQTEWPSDDIYAEFLMDEVLRGDFEARQDALAKATHMTIAEKRAVENLPFIPGTDRIFLNTATMPLDAIDAQAAAIAQQTADSDDPLAEVIPLSVARAVMGRLSWQNDLTQVDARALLEGIERRYVKPIVAALAAADSVKDLRDRVRGMIARDQRPPELPAAKTAKAKAKTPDRVPHERQVAKLLEGFFARQGEEVLSSGTFDKAKWDAELTSDLHATAVAVSSSIGKATMRELGYPANTYDVSMTLNFLEAVAGRLASNINTTTQDRYDEADEPADVFAQAVDSRAGQIAVGVTTLVAGFGVVEAGKQLAESEGVEPTKTWITGPNPRPEHAALNGQTVPISSTFSNGMDWPGSGGSGNDAGCNCQVQIEF